MTSKRPGKKSKFSVVPFGQMPPESTSILKSGVMNQSSDCPLLKKSSLNYDIYRPENSISGLEQIKEDCVESRSDVILEDQKAEISDISNSVLQNQQLGTQSRCWKSSYRDSKQEKLPVFRASRFEPQEDYYTNKQNCRRQSSWVATPTSSRINVRQTLKSTVTQPSGEDVYELFSRMQNKLQTLKSVIEKQKIRLYSPSPTTNSSRQGSSSLSRRHESKYIRSSRSDYIRKP